MVSVLFIKQVNLVVKHLDTYQYGSLIVAASTYGFIKACLRILPILVLVSWVFFHRFGIVVSFVKEERQQDQIVIEIL